MLQQLVRVVGIAHLDQVIPGLLRPELISIGAIPIRSRQSGDATLGEPSGEQNAATSYQYATGISALGQQTPECGWPQLGHPQQRQSASQLFSVGGRGTELLAVLHFHIESLTGPCRG